MSHQISLQQAVEMTTRYRQEKENILITTYRNQNILCICETFGRDDIDKILAQTDCQSLRIYYGMDSDLKIHAIIVGVNSSNEDILPETSLSWMSGYDTGIVDDGQRCPPHCPPNSELNFQES